MKGEMISPPESLLWCKGTRLAVKGKLEYSVFSTISYGQPPETVCP